MSAAETPFEHQVLNQALELAALGYRELYVRQWRKEPALPDWPSAATTDPVILHRWFGNSQQYNLGLACGPQPNGENIVVIDIDPKNGGVETWNSLVETHGALPDTPMTVTPSGGFHIYTNAPAAIRNTRRLGQGIDIRGAGGQVLMPPSRLKDADGVITRYSWIEGMALGQLAVAGMAEWVVEMLLPPVPAPKLSVVREQDFRHDEISPAEWVRENMSFEQALAAHGWHDLGLGHWKRPGKTDEGHSALLHDNQVLNIFTTEIPPGLERLGKPDGTGTCLSFSLFDFLAGSAYGGDRVVFARVVRETLMPQQVAFQQYADAGFAVSKIPIEVEDGDDGLIDWSTIDEAQQPVIDGLAYPGRWTQIVAAAKQGKSLLLVTVSVQVSLGREPLDGTVQEPVEVLYCDMEMGRMDLRERLEECGVADPSMLTHWHARDLPLRLDHPEGAAWVLDTVDRLGIKLVIIDGLNGTIEGAEKDDTPWRDLYKHTIHPLKSRGIAVVTADNLGKDATLGPRGSSVKMDKADAVIVLTREDGGVKLTTTHRRTAAFPKEAHLELHGIEDVDIVSYNRKSHGYPAGTHEMVEILNRLGVPLEDGRPKVVQRLKDEGLAGGRAEVLSAAIKYRKLHQS